MIKRACIIALGTQIALAMVGVSMSINYIAGFELGQHGTKALVFGWLSVVADAWKAIGLIFVAVLMRDRKRTQALAAFAVWAVCLLYAITSASGLIVEARGAVIEGRESIHTAFESTRRDLDEIQAKHHKLQSARSIGEIEAAIGTAFAKPASVGSTRTRTVGDLSDNCKRHDSRTIEVCIEVARLREELARAVEAARFEANIRTLKQQLEHLRMQGGSENTDPQGRMISRLTRGLLQPQDATFVRALLAGLVIEFVSAFGLGIVAAYAEATMRSRATILPPVEQPARAHRWAWLLRARDGVELQAPPTIEEFMAENIRPDTGSVAMPELYLAFRNWCDSKQCPPLREAAFFEQFDRFCAEALPAGAVHRHGYRYVGIRLVTLMSIEDNRSRERA